MDIINDAIKKLSSDGIAKFDFAMKQSGSVVIILFEL